MGYGTRQESQFRTPTHTVAVKSYTRVVFKRTGAVLTHTVIAEQGAEQQQQTEKSDAECPRAHLHLANGDEEQRLIAGGGNRL